MYDRMTARENRSLGVGVNATAKAGQTWFHEYSEQDTGCLWITSTSGKKIADFLPGHADKVIHLYVSQCEVGTSNLAAQYLGYRLPRLGISVLSFQGSHLQLISTAFLGRGSLVISISHSGATKEVINLVRAAREKGAATISITNYERSPLAKYSDTMLLTSSKETPFGSGAASSIIAQLVVIDALFVGLALYRHETSFSFLEKTGETVKSQKT